MAEPRVVGMILAYNCAPMLARAVSRIPREYLSDVFLTDDGSTDGTREEARRLGVAVIGHSPNRGYGGNVKAGLKHALSLGADYVVEIHGDGAQFNPAAIEQALPLIDSGYDFILGSRFQRPLQALAHGMPIARWLANQGLSFFDRLVLHLPLTEFHTGFRIYSRRLIETVPYTSNADDYLFSFQIIAQAAYSRLKIGEVPVEADYHSAHTSHAMAGAAFYAVRTFGTLGQYVLARRGLRHNVLFP
ncbi:MAG: glycosyltransferase family 2 protein [Candidatus Andersenbacteria bacterium]|nr:glycosyltransferase family 2 protein [Candidatus Andersenbacteria bacterium]